MRTINFIRKIYPLAIFIVLGGCAKESQEDPCLQTKWLQPKEYEIKLAVHVMETNPDLPGGTSGSLNPVDFEEMNVDGTIQKVDCSDQKSDFYDLGKSYITRGVDLPAPIDVSESWWIGHVVYVYELGNDKDHLNINLTITITMKDNHSYLCNIVGDIDYTKILKAPGEMYYYILMEIYSDKWVKA